MTAPNIPESAEAPSADEGRDGVRRVLARLRRRPLLTIFAAFGLIAIVDLALLPWGTIHELEKKPPGVTAFQQAYLDGQRRAKRKATIVKHWRSLDRISEDLIAAVIVAEDGTFWSHDGFDWFEVKESLVRNLREQRAARGASTITQQLVKNLFLSPSKNPLRKYHEFLLTWYTERILTKRRILELYLNEIEWGKGIYGAEAAARTYYGISAAELSRDQAIRLAAVIPNPIRYQPTSGSRAVERRAGIVLRRLEARGLVRGRAEDLPETTDVEVAPSDTLIERP